MLPPAMRPFCRRPASALPGRRRHVCAEHKTQALLHPGDVTYLDQVTRKVNDTQPRTVQRARSESKQATYAGTYFAVSDRRCVSPRC